MDRGLQRAAQTREIHASVDVRCVGNADEHCVRRLRGPAREIGGTEIRGIELGAGNLGNAVDAAGAGYGRTPPLSPRQGLARRDPTLLGCSQTRQADCNAARRDPFDKLTPRGPHASTFGRRG